MSEGRKDYIREGVGIVLFNKDNKVFVGKRNRANRKMVSWFLNKPWQMPQGGIESGEAPVNAVLRELHEETGIKNVEILAETDGWLEYKIPNNLRRRDSELIGQRQKWFLLKFLGNDDEINVNCSDHNEFDVWKWMNMSNIIRLSVHFKRKLYIDVFRQFRPYFDCSHTASNFELHDDTGV
jgi:putative (di)nucleoside polyphosphate hydrolase